MVVEVFFQIFQFSQLFTSLATLCPGSLWTLLVKEMAASLHLLYDDFFIVSKSVHNVSPRTHTKS